MALMVLPDVIAVSQRVARAAPGVAGASSGGAGMRADRATCEVVVLRGDIVVPGEAVLRGPEVLSEPEALSEVETPRDARRRIARDARVRRMASAAVEGSLFDLRLTRRGRWVLSSTALVLATGVAVMGGGALASTPDVPAGVVPYTVSAGDNLWGIAKGLARPGEDLRDVVDLIVEVNGRSTAALWAGEQIMLPVRD